VDECSVGASSLVAGVAPVDGSIAGIEPVRSFDDRMVEKLWIFNSGHAAAAYLGWHAGYATLDAAMGDAEIRNAVAAVVEEAQQAFEAYLAARPGADPIPPRQTRWVLDRYADPGIGDPVVRVAREPRRKLAAEDRLVGPGVACLSAGIRPEALSVASAAALAYHEATDPQATELRRELEFLGPEEVFAAVATLDQRDAFARLVAFRYHTRAFAGRFAGLAS
jgi:mannitol-1-phosphate 5-dehydrogenase